MLATGRSVSWFPIAWSLLALLCLWLTVASALDPGGAWWVPVTFGACTLVAAGSVITWLREHRKRNPPDVAGSLLSDSYGDSNGVGH